MFLKKLREKLKWLDPFTYVDLWVMPRVNPKENEIVSWVVYLVSAFVFAWLIYTGLGLLLGTGSPMMIVVSSSMEPLYHRGDIIILHGATAENIEAIPVQLGLALNERPFSDFAKAAYRPVSGEIQSIEFDSGASIPITKDGSILVYWSEHMKEPIVHRAVAKLSATDGVFLLTKGDSVNNTTIDQDCGRVIGARPEKPCIELYPVPIEKVQGKSVLWVPFFGCFKLWLLDDLGSLAATGQLPKEWESGNVC